MPKAQAAGMGQSNEYAGDRLFEAGTYDNIFDVECGDGVMRKLPFNIGDNIDVAANKFCIRENFSKEHISQIKEFLTVNTRGQVPTSNIKKKEEPKSTLKVTPMSSMQFFEKINTDGPKKQIEKFEEEESVIPEKQKKCLDAILHLVSEKGMYHSSKIYKNELEFLESVLKWPVEKMIPVLDVFRMYLMHP
jgi:phospholipase A-2-activating protein